MKGWYNMSIKELRIKALERFNEKYIHNMEKATNFSNRFYRLCGLSERLFYMNNDAEIYNRRKRWIEEEEKKEDRAIQRLKNELKQYGLTIYYFGYLPTITELDNGKPNGTEALARWFYN